MPLQKTEVKDTHDDQQQQLDGASRIQVEIVYVAASQKPTKQVKEEEKDTIVVVCQARQKRKRTKAQLQQNGTEKSNEPTADEVPSSSTLLEKRKKNRNRMRSSQNHSTSFPWFITF